MVKLISLIVTKNSKAVFYFFALLIVVVLNYNYGIVITTIIQEKDNTITLNDNKFNQTKPIVGNKKGIDMKYSEALTLLEQDKKMKLPYWSDGFFIFKSKAVVIGYDGKEHHYESVFIQKGPTVAPQEYLVRGEDSFNDHWEVVQ